MDIPTHLSHKPIVKLEDYTQLDGKFANQSDAEGLSIGLAQWSDAEEMDLSAKIVDRFEMLSVEKSGGNENMAIY